MEQNEAATDVDQMAETHILYDTRNILFSFVLTPVTIDSLLLLPDLSLEFLGWDVLWTMQC
jgi:hypothetical protein